jgi:phosphatidylserine decarboxylase
VFDVHVNRAPIAALVQEVTHTPGRFMAAWGEEASQQNEQTLIRFATPDGDVWVKQIAGLIARRIVCRVRPGQKVAAGDRIGLIRFGSRVDCILPEAAVLRVRRGQMVKGGSTILGVIP